MLKAYLIVKSEDEKETRKDIRKFSPYFQYCNHDEEEYFSFIKLQDAIKKFPTEREYILIIEKKDAVNISEYVTHDKKVIIEII